MIALQIGDAGRGQQHGILCGLGTLGHGLETATLGEAQQRFEKHQIVRVLRKATCEQAVDLDDIHRQGFQVPEGG